MVERQCAVEELVSVSGRFEVIAEALGGAKLLRRKKIADDRGFLSRLFDPNDLEALGWSGPVAQINETGTTTKGTLRGFHFQHPPFAETKLVACTAGAIYDVALDLRRGSPTFLQHFGVELSAENGCSFLIPAGFAHGFQTLTDDVRMIYAHSAPYSAQSEDGLNCLDPAVGVDWPLPVSIISERDSSRPMVSNGYQGVAA